MSKKFKNLKPVTSIKKIPLHKEVTKTGATEQCQNREELEHPQVRRKKP